MTVDFPEPVGPTSANRSTPSKSISVELAERAEALRLEPDRPHRRELLVEQRGEERDEAVVVDAPARRGTPRTGRAGSRPRRSARGRGARRRSAASIRTSTTRSPSSARTSSASPARAGSVTRTRSHVSARSSAAAMRLQLGERARSACAAAPRRSAGSARPTPAARARPRRAATCLPAPASPKSTWIGEPEYQIGAPPGQLLGEVQVAERDVARRPRERARVDPVVLERGLRVALAAAGLAAPHHAVRDDEVHRAAAEVARSARRGCRASAPRTRPTFSTPSWLISSAARTA